MANNHEHEHEHLEEQDDNIIILTDEEGQDVEFQYVTTLERDGSEYVVLMLLDQEEADEDDGEVVILKIETDEDGEDFYVSIDDDELSDSLFEEFIELIEDEDEEN